MPLRGRIASKPEKAKNPIPKALLDLHSQLEEQWVIDLYKLINEENLDGSLFGINKEGKCGKLTMVPTVINVSNGDAEVALIILIYVICYKSKTNSIVIF